MAGYAFQSLQARKTLQTLWEEQGQTVKALENSLEDFAGCVLAGFLTPEQKQSMEAATVSGMEAPGLLTDEEIGELLIRDNNAYPPADYPANWERPENE